MIRSILLCSALVASSTVGALALSFLHEAAYEVQTSRVNTPEVSGSFVVPAFAPVRTRPMLETPASPSAAAETATPIALDEPEVLFLTPLSNDNTDIAPETNALAPAIVKRPAERSAKPKAATRVLPTPTESAPIVVYQVSPPSPVAAPTTQRQAAVVFPAYYIGVFR